MRTLVSCFVTICISATAPTLAAPAPVKPSPAPSPATAPVSATKHEAPIWLGAVFRENTPSIQSVIPAGPAARAGLRAGDRILSIGGETINRAEDVTRVMARCRVGASVDVVVVRDSTQLTIAVTAATRPNPVDIQRTALIGKLAPDIQLPTLDGGTVKLADLKGRVVVLDFWATWCRPCVAALPHLDAWHRRLGSKGLVVIGITQEDADDVKVFLADGHAVAYPIALDGAADALRKYRVQGLPLTVVIDKTGVIRSAEIGVGELSVMEAKLTTLLR